MQLISVLTFQDLWWPFGAHLLHTKWAYLSARAIGAKFVYVRSVRAKLFPTGRLTDYFEPWSNDVAETAQKNIIGDGLACYRELDAASYLPFGCVNKAEAHSAALRFL